MLGSKIWERYFLSEITKSCCFFLATFYGLYVMIDYASHTASLHHHHVHFQWSEIALYYACEFVKRLEILLPFALLIATIQTASNLNVHNELVALLSSGISMFTLMRPFLLIGLVGVGLVYVSTNFVLPSALRELKHIDASRSSKKQQHYQQASAQHLVLEDNSTLIYKKYDPAQHLFVDVYWIRNIDEIYRMQSLSPNSDTADNAPTGHFVDHLVRNAAGNLTAIASSSSQSFPEMLFNKEQLFDTMTPAEDLAIAELWSKLPNLKEIRSEKEAQTLSVFYHKLIMPWLCLFAVMGPIPFCLRVTRNLPMFFIYAGGIFGIVAFDLIMSAAVLLGKRQSIAPSWALWPPFALFASVITFRFVRQCR